jgi:hypothetical protein
MSSTYDNIIEISESPQFSINRVKEADHTSPKVLTEIEQDEIIELKEGNDLE